MEEEARDEAEECEAIRERGTNFFYNTTQLPEDRSDAFSEIVTPWLSGNNVNVQQVKISHKFC